MKLHFISHSVRQINSAR